MGIRRLAPGGWLWTVLGVLLFLLVFLSVVAYTLPGDAVLSVARPLFARSGFEISAASARMELPLALRLDGAAIRRNGGGTLHLDTVRAAWEWTGLFRWLPFRATITKGQARVRIRTSPRFWNPGKGRLSISDLAGEDFAPLVSLKASGVGFLLKGAEVRWRRRASGAFSGMGTGRFAWLRVPIPDRSSPIREALLRDVTIRFALRGQTLVVSSLAGTWEGARVAGTGEVADVLSPARSTVTLLLTIANPFEGKVAAIFDLLAKNAKNATLRITGSVLSPKAEVRFF